MLFDIKTTNIFFGYLPSGTGNKSKNKQMGLYQTENILDREENYQ